MVTIKQLEAFYWISQLRTFDRAASRLHTTQSAVSKRIQDLEAAIGFAVFERHKRGVRLTLRGERLLEVAVEMLSLQRRALSLRHSAELPERSFNLGVTELSAITWLPRFVNEFRRSYEPMTIRPKIGKSAVLIEGLMAGHLEMIVVPEMPVPAGMSTIPLRDVKTGWMAKPTFVPGSASLSLDELADLPFVMQERTSLYSSTLRTWLAQEGVLPREVMKCNSLHALVGLTVAGLGVSYLPRNCFQPLVDDGKLKEIVTIPAPPTVPYVVMVMDQECSEATDMVAALIGRMCDFDRQFQA